MAARERGQGPGLRTGHPVHSTDASTPNRRSPFVYDMAGQRPSFAKARMGGCPERHLRPLYCKSGSGG
jgi:hypothetical protein